MITHAYEKDKEQLFELVKENDIQGLQDLLIALRAKDQSARIRIGKFAGFLDDPVYDLNKIYMNDKSLIITACEYGNPVMIQLLADHYAVFV